MTSLAHVLLQAMRLVIMGNMVGTLSAVNLLFFGAGDNCYASTDHIGCYNIPGDVCCFSADPFCTTFELSNTDDNLRSIWAISGEHCILHNGYKTCSQKGAHHTDCCIDIFGYNTSTCSAFWGINLGGGKNVMDPGNATNGECLQPNKMAYNDGGGMKEIFLPNGTFHQAVDSYKDKDYGALASYGSWEYVMGNNTDRQSN